SYPRSAEYDADRVILLARRLQAVTQCQIVLLQEVAAIGGDPQVAQQMIASTIERFRRCLDPSALTPTEAHSWWKKLAAGVLLRMALRLWEIGQPNLSRLGNSVLRGCIDVLTIDDLDEDYTGPTASLWDLPAL